MKFLTKTMTLERAKDLTLELGFMGIVDLLLYLASTTDGGIECKGERIVVQIKPLKKPSKKREKVKP
jgi:hypothetical protein